MTAPRWYRGPSPLWGVVIALALALALGWSGWFVVRATVTAIRTDERARVLREGDRLASLRWDAERQQLERRLDSLRREAARVDTVLVTRIQRVQSQRWLPADTAAPVRLAACIAQLDTLATGCASFREAATKALAQATTNARRDSAAFAGLSLASAARRRTDSLTIAALTARALSASTWRTAERTLCLASLGTNYLQWRTR